MSSAQFIRVIRNPIKFRLFLLTRLPSTFFSGLRIPEVDETHCVVSIPYKWFTRNPFRSTYFACLGMAAEMSTGALAMAHVYKRKPAVSMLVVGMESKFSKKAVGVTRFTCVDGVAMREIIQLAVDSGEPWTFRARSVGVNEAGEEVAEFFITWSFKAKSHK